MLAGSALIVRLLAKCDLKMAQSTHTGFPSLEDDRRQDRENAVNIVLKDMQRFLPAEVEPAVLTAMRDYMVTKLGRSQTFDKFYLRHASMEILIKDATERLHNLYDHAQVLLTEFSKGHPDGEAFVHTHYNFSEENYYRVLKQNGALEAQRVQCESEYVTLRTRNQLLEESLEFHQDMLQRTVREREQAREMVLQRDYELEEERKRSKHVVERVERERDRANRTANYLFPQLHDLETRLRDAEQRYGSTKCSADRVINTRSEQGQTAAVRDLPASTGIDGRSAGASTKPVVAHRQNHESRQDLTAFSGSVSRFAKFFEPSERLDAKQGENACVTTEDKVDSRSPSDGSPVENPVSPRQVIPCVPLMAPKAAIRAGSSKQEHDGASPQKTVSVLLVWIARNSMLINDEKDNTAHE